MKNNINAQINDTIELLGKIDANIIFKIASMAAECFINGGKLYICGSSTSGWAAQYAATILMNRCMMYRPPLPAIALQNDISYTSPCDTDIFEKQIIALATPADIVWGFAADDSPEPVVRALRCAAQNKTKTVGFFGKNSNNMHGICDIAVSVSHTASIRVQEIHLAIIHLICDTIDQVIFSQHAGEMN